MNWERFESTGKAVDTGNIGATPESISRAQAILVVFIAACLIFSCLAMAGGLG